MIEEDFEEIAKEILRALGVRVIDDEVRKV